MPSRPPPSPPKRGSQSLQALRSQQKLMGELVMHPLNRRGNTCEQWKVGQSTRQIARTFIKPNDRLSSLERLQIYNRQYWYRIWDCFYQDFPGLKAVVGDRKFHALATRYLEQHPSESFTLRNLGRKIMEFVKRDQKKIGARWRLAFDVVQVEWAHIHAFDGEGCPRLDQKQFQNVPPSRLRLKLQPYLSLLELEYPVDDFLIQVRRRESLRSEASQARAHHQNQRGKRLRIPKRKKTYLAVHRIDGVVYYKSLSESSFLILHELLKGATLQKACEQYHPQARETPEESARQIQIWFQNWMSLGWFCSFEHGSRN